MPNAPRLHAHHCTEAIADVIGEEVILAKPVSAFGIGGCSFSEPAWETCGKQVELILSFPEQHVHIPLQGLVSLSSLKNMEIRFMNLSQEQRWALEKTVRRDQDRSKRR